MWVVLMIIYQFKPMEQPAQNQQMQFQDFRPVIDNPQAQDQIRRTCSVFGIDYNEVNRYLRQSTIVTNEPTFRVDTHDNWDTRNPTVASARVFATYLIRGMYNVNDANISNENASRVPVLDSQAFVTAVGAFNSDITDTRNGFSNVVVTPEQRRDIVREGRRLGLINGENDELRLLHAYRTYVACRELGEEQATAFARQSLTRGVLGASSSPGEYSQTRNEEQRERTLNFTRLVARNSDPRENPDGQIDLFALNRTTIRAARDEYLVRNLNNIVPQRLDATVQSQLLETVRGYSEQELLNAPLSRVPETITSRIRNMDQITDSSQPLETRIQTAIVSLQAVRDDAIGQDRAAVDRAIEELRRNRRNMLS